MAVVAASLDENLNFGMSLEQLNRLKEQAYSRNMGLNAAQLNDFYFSLIFDLVERGKKEISNVGGLSTKHLPKWKVSFEKTSRVDKDGVPDEDHIATVYITYFGVRFYYGHVRNGENGIYISYSQVINHKNKWVIPVKFGGDDYKKVEDDVQNKFKVWAERNNIKIASVEPRKDEGFEDDMPF